METQEKNFEESIRKTDFWGPAGVNVTLFLAAIGFLIPYYNDFSKIPQISLIFGVAALCFMILPSWKLYHCHLESKNKLTIDKVISELNKLS